jgi:molybdopterin molybdotransferase
LTLTELLSVQEAQQRILSHFSPVEAMHVALESSARRILAEDITSDLDLPPFDNSSMDGYAVRAADLAAAEAARPAALAVVAEIPAGSVPEVTLQPGQAARIMTGAPLPEGADSVIPVEDTRPEGDGSPGDRVLALRPVRPGEFIRPRGQDVRRGQVVLRCGRRLRPQDVGMLATLGMPIVPVFRRPRVAILSSGSEIVAPGAPLAPGKIRDSNTFTLAALVEAAGAEAFRLGVAADSLDEVRELFDLACAKPADLILSSAGVSVGSFDYVRSLIEAEGKLDFWRVNMRPGKPVTFGAYCSTPFIGLPGNPVSAFVGFEIFVRPVLARLGGRPDSARTVMRAVLAEPLESDGRESYLRGILSYQDGRLVARQASHQGSGNLFSLVLANALLIVPSGVKSLRIGAEIGAYLLVDEIE